MLKQWLDAGKCMLGFHQGDWVLQGSDRCVLVQTCDRCGTASQRVEHLWSDWAYAAKGRCDLSRACTRCGESERRTEHQWGVWMYRQRGSCEQRQQCDRCRVWADTSRVSHQWDAWEYSEQYRAPLRSCRNCALRKSYFADQAIDQNEAPPDTADQSLTKVMAIIEQLTPEAPPAEAAPPKLEDQPSRCNAILGALAATLERDGFSEYVFRQAMTGIQELPNGSAEDGKMIREGLLRMIDITMPYAPSEVAQTLVITRSAIQQQGEPGADDDEPFTPDQMRVEGENILQELKANLAAGESPSPAITRAITKFSALGQHVAAEDEECGKILLGTMSKLQEVILPYAPEGAKHAFLEGMATMDLGISAIDVATSGDQVGEAIFETQAAEQLGRLDQAADPQSIPSEFAAIPHIRQFVELLRVFMDRFNNPMLRAHAGKSDQAEIDRLRKRLEPSVQMLRAAYSEAQIIRHQRDGLRRVALEFSHFERRHHLMAVHPVFPTNPVTIDPNCVFFSGTELVADLVNKACDTLGMIPAPMHGLQNKTHARWQQLRGSGIAILDYSAYDPVHADPGGRVPRSGQAEEKVLGAAGPVATVAYETGWAYVLGTPMVIVARKGQLVPFDIDVEPVLLEGDERDVERLIAAIQAGLYGVQHGIAGDCLADTLEHVRKRYGDHADPQVRALLGALSDVGDATRVRMALAAIIDRIEGENPLLVIPAFPGSYPADGRRQLFHVSAFRDWTKVVQAEVKMACERARVNYRIGYERINPDILRVVWTDICQASFVIADITNLNPNAVLELAMAQAVGRPTLILTQNLQPHSYLPAIQKVRTHKYDTDGGRANLPSLIDSFLAGTE